MTAAADAAGAGTTNIKRSQRQLVVRTSKLAVNPNPTQDHQGLAFDRVERVVGARRRRVGCVDNGSPLEGEERELPKVTQTPFPVRPAKQKHLVPGQRQRTPKPSRRRICSCHKIPLAGSVIVDPRVIRRSILCHPAKHQQQIRHLGRRPRPPRPPQLCSRSSGTLPRCSSSLPATLQNGSHIPCQRKRNGNSAVRVPRRRQWRVFCQLNLCPHTRRRRKMPLLGRRPKRPQRPKLGLARVPPIQHHV